VLNPLVLLDQCCLFGHFNSSSSLYYLKLITADRIASVEIIYQNEPDHLDSD
jgi:hypothetical protein